MSVKIIANYLPQYHRTKDNDRFWGEGYTDWVGVKNARPVIQGQVQPREPKNDFYYDLSNVETIRWQANLARSYGIYGFGIYHYWFSTDKQELTKPAELLLENKDIDIHYLFIWDNVSWIRSWSAVKNANEFAPQFDKEKKEFKADDGVLAKLEYGIEEDWTAHYDYLRKFFLDSRYIKMNNKPVFCIYRQENEPKTLINIIKLWNKLAIEDGFNGIEVIGRRNNKRIRITNIECEYEPLQSAFTYDYFLGKVYNKIRFFICRKFNLTNIYNYDKIWNKIIRTANRENGEDYLYCGFVDFDDTPRRGKNCRLILGSTPEKFGQYMKKLIWLSNRYHKEYVFITAWNEWGEGAYLEPDKKNNLMYLEELKKAVESQ